MTWTIAILILALVLAAVAAPVRAAEPEAAAQPATDAESRTKLTIALLQMVSVGEDQAANLAKADDYCRKAAAMGADIALMPEIWNTGYGKYPGETRKDADKWAAMAVARDSDYVRHFAKLAKELNMAIVVTYLRNGPKRPGTRLR